MPPNSISSWQEMYVYKFFFRFFLLIIFLSYIESEFSSFFDENQMEMKPQGRSERGEERRKPARAHRAVFVRDAENPYRKVDVTCRLRCVR